MISDIFKILTLTVNILIQLFIALGNLSEILIIVSNILQTFLILAINLTQKIENFIRKKIVERATRDITFNMELNQLSIGDIVDRAKFLLNTDYSIEELDE